MSPEAGIPASGLFFKMPVRSHKIFLALALVATLGTSSGSAEPRATFDATEYNFEGVRRGEKVVGAFRLFNAGDAPLELTGVDLSMPGMTARLPASIAPGESGAIVLEWATDRVQGSVRGMAVIGTNDPHQRSVTLAMVGTVRPPIEIEPVPAVFLSSFQGESVRRELTLRSNQPDPVTMRLPSRRGQYYAADLETVQPGRSWRLTVKPAPGTLPGRYDEVLELESSDPGIGTLRIPVHVLVKADLHASPSEINFGEVPLDRVLRQPGAVRFLEQIVLVTKRQGRFRVRRIRSDVAGLDFRTTPESGESGTFRIDVGLRPELLRPASLDGVISIDTDDPAFPQLTIRVRGHIVEK